MKVGDRVILTTDIYEEGEDLPPGYIAFRGETVVIRSVRSKGSRPYSVSHENIVDKTFAVDAREIKEKR